MNLKRLDELNELLQPLTAEQCVTTLEHFRDELEKTIQTPEDVAQVFRVLKNKNARAFYSVMKDQIKNMIDSADDFKLVVSYLGYKHPYLGRWKASTIEWELRLDIFNDQSERSWFCEMDSLDIFFLVSSNEVNLFALCETMKNIWPNVIKSVANLCSLKGVLREELFRGVLFAMKDNLWDLINSPHDCSRLKSYLSTQQSYVFQLLKDSAPTVDHLAWIMSFLTPQELFSECSEVLFARIKSSNDVALLLYTPNNFSLDQVSSIYKVIKNQLPDIIVTIKDFKVVFKYLCQSPKIKQDFIEYMNTKGMWKKIINSVDDLQGVMDSLAPDQPTAVYDAIKNILPHFIQTLDEFKEAQKYVPFAQRAKFYMSIGNVLQKIINTRDDFGDLSAASFEQCEEINRFLKKHFPTLTPLEYTYTEPNVSTNPANLTRSPVFHGSGSLFAWQKPDEDNKAVTPFYRPK